MKSIRSVRHKKENPTLKKRGVDARTIRPENAVFVRVAGLSSLEVIGEAKLGMRGKEFGKIQEASHFSDHEWSRFLQRSPRTIQRYRNQNLTIDSASTERVLLIAQIVEQGREVFGTDDRMTLWLKTPSRALAEMRPFELLDTTTGMYLVKAELVRIAHGVY